MEFTKFEVISIKANPDPKFFKAGRNLRRGFRKDRNTCSVTLTRQICGIFQKV